MLRCPVPLSPQRRGLVADKPVAEIEITEALVRELLRAQHPDLAELALTLVAEGWDNAMWRLGPELAVRVPRRAAAAGLVRHEQRWLPELAPRLGTPVPTPVRLGAPTRSYPWHWSVVPWFPGLHAIELPRDATAGLLGPLAGFLADLHVPAPSGAPENPFRGIPLAGRDAILRERLPLLPLEAREPARAVWQDATSAPAWDGPPVWLHGDLHPGNIVVADDGSLAAVVDFGDLCAGDPAVDLAVAWYLFDAHGRTRFMSLVPGDEAMWRRARGWALSFATALVLHSDDNPEYRTLGERTLTAVLDG